MNEIQNELNRYLTLKDIAKLQGTADYRNIQTWISKGLRVKKGKHTWSEPIILKTIKTKSTVLVTPEDLKEFFEKTGKDVTDIPTYLR